MPTLDSMGNPDAAAPRPPPARDGATPQGARTRSSIDTSATVAPSVDDDQPDQQNSVDDRETFVLPTIVPATEDLPATEQVPVIQPSLPATQQVPAIQPSLPAARTAPPARPTSPATPAARPAPIAPAPAPTPTRSATGWADHMTADPQAPGLRSSGRRPRVRRVTRVLRHIDPWSTFKVGLLFSAVGYVVTLTSGVLLWRVADSTGTLDNVERWFTQFGWETFELKGGEVFHNAWIIGLFGAVALTGGLVLLATLFNLVSDIVGGVRVTVLEEEVVERTVSSTRRYVVRRPPVGGGAGDAGVVDDWDVDGDDEPASEPATERATEPPSTRSPGGSSVTTAPSADWSVDD